jgi:hypothetical protein
MYVPSSVRAKIDTKHNSSATSASGFASGITVERLVDWTYCLPPHKVVQQTTDRYRLEFDTHTIVGHCYNIHGHKFYTTRFALVLTVTSDREPTVISSFPCWYV